MVFIIIVVVVLIVTVIVVVSSFVPFLFVFLCYFTDRMITVSAEYYDDDEYYSVSHCGCVYSVLILSYSVGCVRN